MYELLFSSAAERYFKKLKEKPLWVAYQEALLKIARDPNVGKRKRGDLAGIYGIDITYQGINYEIAYTFREGGDRKEVIPLAGTRENFYDQLKRYIR
jgi:mRNA interferase RelE/StbE